MKSTEAQLEFAIIELLNEHCYPYVPADAIEYSPKEVLTKKYLQEFLVILVLLKEDVCFLGSFASEEGERIYD